MKRKIFLFILLLLFFTPIFGSCSTEIIYPTIPGTISPQDIRATADTEAEVFPLFMNYFFRLLMMVSFAIIALVICYAGIVYILSSGDPVKTKFAKDWMLSAIQGALIIFLSYTILFTIDSRFVLFRQIDLESVDELESIKLDWTIKNMYFQIPAGLIIEDTMLNDSGQKKINDILERITRNEHSGEKIERSIKDYLNIINLCGGDACSKENPPGVGPEDPNNRPNKINIFGNSVDLITAKTYLDNNIYNFIDTSQSNFVLPINNWQQGDIVLGGPDAVGGVSNNDFNAINGSAIRLYGEDRIATEMALRLAIKYDKEDINYGSLSVKYLEPKEVNNWKVLAEFKWNKTMGFSCPDNEERRIIGDGKLIINPLLDIKNATGKGFIIIREEDPDFCPPFTIWGKDNGNWVIYCIEKGHEYINDLNIKYGDTIYKEDCPTSFGFIENLGWLSYEELTPPTPPGMCPNTIYRTLEMSKEIDYYNNHLFLELEELINKEKEQVIDSLFQLTKIMILKALGKDEIIPYTTYLQERSYYNREDVAIATDIDWLKWVINGEPNITDIYYNTNKTQNDPATFYLKMPGNNKMIDDALLLARDVKNEGFTDIGVEINNDQSFLLNTFQKISSFLKIFFYEITTTVFAGSEIEEVKECLREKIGEVVLPEDEQERFMFCVDEIDDCFYEKDLNTDILTDPSLINELLQICDIDDTSSLFSEGEYLQCGTEIPIGEALYIAWNHLFDIISEIEIYYEEALRLIEQHSSLKRKVVVCDCRCISTCTITSCEIRIIETEKEEILKIRNRMIESKEKLNTLTYKFLNTPTENICNPLNIDIRTEEENDYCLNNDIRNIRKHELILRKLYHARSQFDSCQNFNLSAVLAGETTSKSNIFGSIAEENVLPRITKTRIGGEMVNTSNFNWFCCTD